MLKYSCTSARLVNWVLRQVNDQPGLIFPQKKGWQVHLKMIYPNDQNHAYFSAAIFNQSELLVFVPLNSKSDISHLKFLTHPKLERSIKSEFGLAFNSFQLIFMTCEKNEEYATTLLKSVVNDYNLLMLDYERMSFVSGNFLNSRLEYRLSIQDFDIDLIPNFLPETHQAITDGITNSLFYQNLFYSLNQIWLSGAQEVPLRTVLKKSIPYWRQYRKKDQQQIIDQIGGDLQQVFDRFSFTGFAVKQQKKKNDAVLVTLVNFPATPKGRKELNNWSRKLELALEFLRGEVNQISIENLSIAPGEVTN